MRFSLAVAALSTVASVWAQTDHAVAVGQGGLTFTPSSITVKDGDTVTFSFMAKNHSVVQSTFAKPCERQSTPNLGVDSGFQAIPPAGLNGAPPPQWKITITNATAPLWFFCGQTAPANHCAAGMVFAINATPEKSFETFQATAKGGAPPAGGAPAASSSSSVGGAPATTAPTGGLPTGGATTPTVPNTVPTSLGSVPSGNVPSPAPELTGVSGAQESGAPPPGNGAVKVTGGLTGLVTIAVVAMLL